MTYTTEQIARAIAPYAGMPVVTKTGSEVGHLYYDEIPDTFMKDVEVREWKLLLRPLLELTENELDHFIFELLNNPSVNLSPSEVEVDITTGETGDPIIVEWLCRCAKGKIFLDPSNYTISGLDEDEELDSSLNILAAFDYLRSIGIDLPSLHLGGKTLFEAGLATYSKEVNSGE